jgi:hypothetical protein
VVLKRNLVEGVGLNYLAQERDKCMAVVWQDKEMELSGTFGEFDWLMNDES